jgi:predicted ATPase
MAYPDAWIYRFTDDGLERVAYEDTEHVQVMRSFLNDPGRMLRELLAR